MPTSLTVGTAEKLILGGIDPAAIDPNKFTVITAASLNEIDRTYVYGATPEVLITSESAKSLVGRLGVTPPLVRFTRPDLGPVR